MNDEVKVEKKEAVNHPSHYNVGKYEVIKVIYDWKADFDLGNALKYIARAGHKESAGKDIKDKTIEDLNKARWYLNDYFDRYKNKEFKCPKKHKAKYCIDDVVVDWQLSCPLNIIVKAIYKISTGQLKRVYLIKYLERTISTLDFYIYSITGRKETNND